MGPQPGDYGVSHGLGAAGAMIRFATKSWAGHAFVFVGDGLIVEAVPPVARVSPVGKYPEAVWAAETLTDVQRATITARAHALVGDPYDWLSFAGFALELLKVRTGAQLDAAYKADQWRVCSALVVDCYDKAGVRLWPSAVDPNLVSPADLLNRIVAARTSS